MAEGGGVGGEGGGWVDGDTVAPLQLHGGRMVSSHRSSPHRRLSLLSAELFLLSVHFMLTLTHPFERPSKPSSEGPSLCQICSGFRFSDDGLPSFRQQQKKCPEMVPFVMSPGQCARRRCSFQLPRLRETPARQFPLCRQKKMNVSFMCLRCASRD